MAFLHFLPNFCHFLKWNVLEHPESATELWKIIRNGKGFAKNTENRFFFSFFVTHFLPKNKKMKNLRKMKTIIWTRKVLVKSNIRLEGWLHKKSESNFIFGSDSAIWLNTLICQDLHSCAIASGCFKVCVICCCTKYTLIGGSSKQLTMTLCPN